MDGGIGTVEVDDLYYGTTFEQKQTVNQMVLCAVTQGREDNAKQLGITSVQYLDEHSNKTIAIWTPDSGFSVE